MYISYSEPLSRGWHRMKKALFQPFDLNKWLSIGFTAWLAGLTNCRGGNGGKNSFNRHTGLDELFRFPEYAWNWLQGHPVWFNLIIFGIILLIIIRMVVIWVSSRGKFMFLFNVANEKKEISIPWRDFAVQGNSLFIWRFFFEWIASIVFIIFLIYCFLTSKALYYGDYPAGIVFWKISSMILMFLAYVIVAGYISLFVNDFVVPIMYKARTGISRGWSIFLSLLGRHFFIFIVYGLFIFVLSIAVAIAVVAMAICTCCIGLLLIIIPYIGAVILLPISYTYRAMSIEFLAQFGDDFNVFPPVEEVTQPILNPQSNPEPGL